MKKLKKRFIVPAVVFILGMINLFGRNQYLRYIITKVAVFNISFKVFLHLSFFSANRSEERRVGKEC